MFQWIIKGFTRLLKPTRFHLDRLAHLKDEPVPEVGRNLGVPSQEVDDAPHDPGAGRLARMDARRQNNHLLPFQVILDEVTTALGHLESQNQSY